MEPPVAYCTLDELFTLGLSAQAFVTRPWPIEAADVDGTTGTIRKKAHGLTAADLVAFEVTGGGALPTGVTAFTTYHPVVVSFDLFRLSATLNGTALTFASVGSGWSLAVDPQRRIQAHADASAAEIDQHLTAYHPPIAVDPSTGLYPQILVELNARMAARAAVTTLQIQNPAYKTALDRLFAQEEFDKAMLDRLSRGAWPLNPAPTDQTTTVVENGAVAFSAAAGGTLDWGNRAAQGRFP